MNGFTTKHLRCPVLAAALLLAGTGAAHAANYSATLTAAPTNYSGKCPAKIEFKGVIKTDKPGRVQYKFIRSDGAFAPIQTLEFAAAGGKEVSTTWTLGGASLPSYSGWQAIEVVYPTSLQSNKAAFRIACKTAKPAVSAVTAVRAPVAVVKPEITGYRLSGKCIAKGRQLTILGRHFGTQAGKSVALGGHGIHVDLPVSSWSDNRIVVTLPDDARIAEGQWYYTGIEKNDHSAWLSNISKNVTICAKPKPEITGYRFSGKCVAKGSQLTILGRHFGDQTGKGVALGGHGIHVDLSVVSWTNSRIVVDVPNDARIADGQWYYTGVEKAGHDGWLSNISENITMCKSATPTVSAVIAARAPVAIVKPEITGYRHPGRCIAKGSQFTILGRHFGEQNGRHVMLGGHRTGVELPVRSWDDTRIVVSLPNNPRIAEGQWYYTGIRNAENNRWLSNISAHMSVCAR